MSPCANAALNSSKFSVSNSLRHLPSVDRVLRDDIAVQSIQQHGREQATQAVRNVLNAVRSAARNDPDFSIPDAAQVATQAASALSESAKPSLRKVFNLTGTLIHTNLGRALLGKSAAQAALTAAVSATTLEYDLANGKRGDRDSHVEGLICEMTGAEAATVVNNNAAAVMLVLNTLAQGREVPVSRGELVEIGDAFRIPDIMARSGAVLREVGTTNRTHARDFENAIGEHTAALMKVHTSNYVIQGFTSAVDPSELAAIAHRHGIPMVNDLGSGTLVDLKQWGLPPEPTVREALEEGADLVTFSGDKVLGGPQAGIIVGTREQLAPIRKNPMRRALRCDKLRIAALEATLRHYRNPETLAETLPTFRNLLRPLDDIQRACDAMGAHLRTCLPESFCISTARVDSQPGSGALPGEALESRAVAITARDDRAVTRLESALRSLSTPIIGRIHDGTLYLDLRALDEDTVLKDVLGELVSMSESLTS